jgi:hypothetical protein
MSNYRHHNTSVNVIDVQIDTKEMALDDWIGETKGEDVDIPPAVVARLNDPLQSIEDAQHTSYLELEVGRQKAPSYQTIVSQLPTPLPRPIAGVQFTPMVLDDVTHVPEALRNT